MTAVLASGADEALASLSAALDAVACVPLDALSESELVEFARNLEVLSRRIPSVVASVDSKVTARCVPASCGYRNDAAFLMATHRLTRRQANARLRLVDQVCGATSLSGGSVPAALPAAGRAFAAGHLTLEHMDVIASAIASLPPTVRAEHGAAAEELLAAHAAEMSSRDLAAVAARLIDTLHPDGDSPDDALPRQAGRFASLTIRPDGWGELKARLTPTALALWQTVLESLLTSGPELPMSGFDDTDAGEAGKSADDFCPDQRTQSEKLHDAFESAARRVLEAAHLPSTAGLPTTLLVTIGLRDLEKRTGKASTIHGGTLTVPEVLRLAAEARVIPVVLGDVGEVLALGRGRRLASSPQRRALIARDRGCTFPGCAKSAAQSEIHHGHEWIAGGTTDVDNMMVACGYHQNEALRQGWRTEMRHGIPWWIPPDHVDRNRTPRRNPVWTLRLRT